MKIDSSSVQADAIRVADHWRRAGLRSGPSALSVDSAVETALDVVAGIPRPPPAETARFCIATKHLHLQNPLSLACVTARVLLFGVEVRGLIRIDDATRVSRSLYPRAVGYFTDGPTSPVHWELLVRRFDNDCFTTIFGRAYHPSMVVSGAEIMGEAGLTAAELTALWETGRVPVTRGELAGRYGSRATEAVLGSGDSYEWFRGPLPIGISRVGPSMTAFAMRHERIRGGAPVIVVNGHVPGLTDLFAPQTHVLDLGLVEGGPEIADVRRHLAGHDSRPANCLPGSIRRDAAEGVLPTGDGSAIDSRMNLLHCSDGLLAGLLEVRALLGAQAPEPDLLRRRLRESGLTGSEIDHVVLRDPELHAERGAGRLSDLTTGLPLTTCAREILRVVPAVFGAVNGYADGVGFRTVDRTLQRVVDRDQPPGRTAGGVASGGVASGGVVSETVPPAWSYEASGRSVVERGLVGVLSPAGWDRRQIRRIRPARVASRAPEGPRPGVQSGRTSCVGDGCPAGQHPPLGRRQRRPGGRRRDGLTHQRGSAPTMA